MTDITTTLGLPGPEHCAGCSACVATCPRHALALHADTEGFLQPQVEIDLCIRCGRCAAACPVQHPLPARQPRSVWAAQATDEHIRATSSSGGIFFLLARQVLSQGGSVFGAAFVDTPVPWSVRHVEVTDEAHLSALQGSKYVQSDLGDSFAILRERLQSGRRVLFVGTPCQTAGLTAFLRACAGSAYNDWRDRLLLVSVICHAAPSPRAWQAYLSEEASQSPISNISFRDKSNGWKHYQLKVSHGGGSPSAAASQEHPFLRAFLSELCNRRSCAHCASRCLRTEDDLMLGDYWSVASRFPDFDDDRGSSLVLVNSPRGEQAWEALVPHLRRRISTWEHAQAVNPALIRSTLYGPKRSRFFRRLHRTSAFTQLVTALLQPAIGVRLKVHLARLRNRILHQP